MRSALFTAILPVIDAPKGEDKEVHATLLQSDMDSLDERGHQQLLQLFLAIRTRKVQPPIEYTIPASGGALVQVDIYSDNKRLPGMGNGPLL